jgi:hypothetical protein
MAVALSHAKKLAYRHSRNAERKNVDWLEKVGDEQYRK